MHVHKLTHPFSTPLLAKPPQVGAFVSTINWARSKKLGWFWSLMCISHIGGEVGYQSPRPSIHLFPLTLGCPLTSCPASFPDHLPTRYPSCPPPQLSLGGPQFTGGIDLSRSPFRPDSPLVPHLNQVHVALKSTSAIDISPPIDLPLILHDSPLVPHLGQV